MDSLAVEDVAVDGLAVDVLRETLSLVSSLEELS